VGGGPAGIAAAVAGVRNGLSFVMVERYAYLGGLASGGMALALDDMCNGDEISVRGLCGEMIDRWSVSAFASCRRKPNAARSCTLAQMVALGVFDFHSHVKPQPICYAAAFDPDGYERVANAMVDEANVDLRLHSW